MKPKIGIQLYTLRDYIKTPEDFDATLSRLHDMGVEYVQISAIGDFSAEKQKEILDRYNMKVCVTHKPVEKILDETESQIADHRMIDCPSIGLGMPPEKYRGDSKKVRKLIGETDAIAPVLKENGMTFNYHNHAFEFFRLDDMACSMMDILLEETDPDYFRFIPDAAWIHYAGCDPVDVLRKMKGRVSVLHFKDYIINEKRERHFVSLGKGVVNLKDCYRAACELGIPYIMYEQDDDWVGNDPFRAVGESWAYLKSLSGEK